MHLVYSPDDGGYYWERYSDWATSQLFDSKQSAKQAKKDNRLVWDTYKWDHEL